MFNIRPLCQRNPLWANERLGNSPDISGHPGVPQYTIGMYGCALVSLTMLLNYVGYSETPKTVNDTLKAHNGFQGALLVWGAVQRAYPKVKFISRNTQYNNAKVWWQINVKRMPVMVQVSGAKIGGFYHWVIFCGSQTCNDPWYGTPLSTSYYPTIGSAIYDKV
jgi:hypothetical protein